MKKPSVLIIQIILIIAFLSSKCNAQDSTFVPSLTHKRVFIDTRLLHHGVKANSRTILDLYQQADAQKSIKLYKKSKYFLPIGPPLVLGGIYLGYDAIKGTKMQTEIDGKLYTYYVRPIEQLLGGIAIFAVGICMIEYANEFKSTSVDLYNNKLNPKANDKKVGISLGFTPSGKVGLYTKF